jgi:hypothetical protein
VFDVVANLGLLATAISGARDCAGIRVLTTDTAVRGEMDAFAVKVGVESEASVGAETRGNEEGQLRNICRRG